MIVYTINYKYSIVVYGDNGDIDELRTKNRKQMYDARLQENLLRTERALILAKSGVIEPSLKQVWKDRVQSLGRPSGDRHGRSLLPRIIAGLAIIVGATFWLFEMIGNPLPVMTAVPIISLLWRGFNHILVYATTLVRSKK